MLPILSIGPIAILCPYPSLVSIMDLSIIWEKAGTVKASDNNNENTILFIISSYWFVRDLKNMKIFL
jgi:hypothetical protein